MRIRSKLQRTSAVTAGTAALLLTLSSAAYATSYRQNLFGVGPGGNDTLRVRVLWDSSDVDGDTTYFYGSGNPQTQFTVGIWVEMNGDGATTPEYFGYINGSTPTFQYPGSRPNLAATIDAYITRVQLLSTVYSSPAIAV